MQRASSLIRALNIPGETITASELVCTAWSQAVGAKIAGHTRASNLVRKRLVVEVEDNVWRRQLMALSGQILRNMARHVGPNLVAELEFRIMPRRIQPQRATAAVPTATLFDEADAIADPVMRGLYRASRRKALA
jgi:hypothetical protein